MAEYTHLFPERGSVEFFSDINFKNKNRKPLEFFNSNSYENCYTPYLAQLQNARVWGRNGAVIGAGDYFIKDVSREFNSGMNVDHSIHYTLFQKKPTQVAVNAAVIGTAGANIYYHWMLDILPRLELISKKINLEKISYFITEFTGLPFQVETLSKVGIPQSRIIASNDNWAFHAKAETLYVPSLAGPLGQPIPFQVNYLKNLYCSEMSDQKPFRKLYISREKTGRRTIVNEGELAGPLRKFGFEILECEELSVAQQVKLFSESSVVVSSHGSAFTNLAFCQPGTIVVDIFNKSHVNLCFWQISQINNLDYHIVEGESVPIDDNPKNDNTLIKLSGFEHLLESIIK